MFIAMNSGVVFCYAPVCPASSGWVNLSPPLLPPMATLPSLTHPLSQTRNAIHTEILKLSLPNLMDSGEGDSAKLKMIVTR